jgi:hypothetical protein
MTTYRYDEDFDGFLEDFGEPHSAQAIPAAVFEEYRKKLPEQLLSYWRGVGACGFKQGLFWLVNPADYQATLDSWLVGTKFESRDDLSVIARTGFGKLYVWRKGYGNVLDIHPYISTVYYMKKTDETLLSEADENKKMRFFWGFMNLDECDLKDSADKPMFERALKKLGAVSRDGMYGYKERLSLGGKESVNNLDIIGLEVYHDIAQQMEAPEIFTFTDM